MPELSHLEYLLRGWYPTWLMQMRMWSTEDCVIWIVMACVLLNNARSLTRH